LIDHNRSDYRKKELRQACMPDRRPGRSHEPHHHAAEQRLRHHQTQRSPRQARAQPDRQDCGENRYQEGHGAVREFIANSAFQRRHQAAPGEGPVGHRQGRIVARDQRTGDHQPESTTR
jgi:hypothetical protein